MKTRTCLRLAITLSFTVLLGVIGCGKGEDEVNPQPAPGPATPVPTAPPAPPAPPPPPPLPTCFPVGGQPLSNSGPYVGTLSGQYGSGRTNTLSLNLFYGQPTNANQGVANLLAQGTFDFSDIRSIIGQVGPKGTSFCVASSNPESNTATPGTFYPGYNNINITVRGYIEVPLYTPYGYAPYGGYPGYGGGGYYPGQPSPYPAPLGVELVELHIGGSCGAVIEDNRIFGCVDVTVGSQGYRLQYYAQ